MTVSQANKWSHGLRTQMPKVGGRELLPLLTLDSTIGDAPSDLEQHAPEQGCIHGFKDEGQGTGLGPSFLNLFSPPFFKQPSLDFP